MSNSRKARAPLGITAQIVALASLSVLLGVVLMIAAALLLFDPPDEQESPAYGIARVAEAAHFVRAANDSAAANSVLASLRNSGIQVELVPLTSLTLSKPVGNVPWTSQLARRQLGVLRGITLLNGVSYGAAPPTQIIVQVDSERALVFDDVPRLSFWPMVLKPTVVFLIIILILGVLLSIYVARAIIRPLSEVARAAAAFGRSTDDQQPLSGHGPREIVQVTEALNDMRARIRALLDDRTRMLAAISHDLRTPLTRLRLRSERIGHSDTRGAMLPSAATARPTTTSVPCLTAFSTTLVTARDSARGRHSQTSRGGPSKLTAWPTSAKSLQMVSSRLDNSIRAGCSALVSSRR